MSGLFGIGGSGSKTDRTNELNSWGDLSSLTQQTSKIGQSNVTAGQNNLNNASTYFNSLLSNKPGAIAQAISPQTNAIAGQTNQRIATANQFGDRSGGTNAEMQSLQTNEQASVQNLINTLLPQAATEVGNLGATQEGLGLTAFGQAGSTANDLGTLTEGARQFDVSQENQLGQSAGQLAMMALLA